MRSATSISRALAVALLCAAGAAGCNAGPIGVAALPSDTLADGLVAHWRFDDGVGTVAHDSSGNGRDGTIFGTGWSWSAGRFGGAAHFSGVDQVTVAAFPAATASYTVSAWLRVASSELTGGLLSTLLSTENGFGGWSLNVGETVTPSYGFGYPTSAQDRAVALCTCLVPDTWSHVAVVVDNGATLTMYVNGAAQATVPVAAAIPPGGATLYMARWYGLGRNLTGALDDVAIYSRALVAEEVGLLASAPAVDPR
jgi:hypothetical protein